MTHPELVYFPQDASSPRVVHLLSFDRLDQLIPKPATFRERFRGRTSTRRIVVPAGIAWRDDTLYVCDTGDNVVHVWNLRDGRSRIVGEGDLAKPVDVAVDDDGAVYVADTGLSSVVVFNPSGSPVPPQAPGFAGGHAPPRSAIHRLRPVDRDAYRPVAIAVDVDRVYVADIAGHYVDAFATADGTHLDALGGVGSDPGRFYYPTGVATDETGRLFVSDMMNGRVQILSHRRRRAAIIGRPGDRYGDLGSPKHLDTGPGGTVFIADAAYAHIHVFDDRGNLLMLFGGPGDRPGHTPMPLGVTVATDVPDTVTALVPPDFTAEYFVFVTNRITHRGVSLFAVGTGTRPTN